MSRLMRWVTAPVIEAAALVNDTLAVLRREERYRDVPAPEPDSGLIAEAVIDGFFTLFVGLMVGVPESQQVRRGQHELIAMRNFIEASGWFEDPKGYHQTPPELRAVQLTDKLAMGLGGRTRYREMLYESEYAPHAGEPGRERWLAHEENGTAVAYLLEHEDGDRPWVIATHGFGMGSPAVNIHGLAADWMHKELGLNVLMPVLPLHGPRSPTRFSGGGLLQPEFANVLHLFAQAIWEIRRLAGWIRNRSDRPIGLHGISLGGYTVALASAFVEDLDCVIAGIPAVDFTSLARDNEPWTYQAYGTDLQTDWSLVRETLYPVSPLTYRPLAPRERRFIYAGVADRVTRPEQARALWRHWEQPRIEWTSSGHVVATLKTGLRPFLREIVAEHLFEPGQAPFATAEARQAS